MRVSINVFGNCDVEYHPDARRPVELRRIAAAVDGHGHIGRRAGNWRDGMGWIKPLTNKRFSLSLLTLLRTGLCGLSQHLFGGAVVVGGADPHAEVLAARHASHCTAVGVRRAVVGLSGVALHLHCVRNSSKSSVPGCDQHVRMTLSSCFYICW